MNRQGLSVIMPVYNGLPFLTQAIESVLHQSHPRFELVIVDDGSSDGSWTYLQSLRDPRVRVFRNETNRGIFDTLNRLVELAAYDTLKIFCQDDEMLPECLDRQHAYLNDHPEVGIARCLGSTDRPYHLSVGARRYQGGLPEIIHPAAAALAFLTFGNLPGNLTNVITRRPVVREAGGFRQQFPYAGDFDMWSRIAHRHAIGLQPETLVTVHSHPRQGSVTLGRKCELVAQHDAVLRFLFARLDASDRALIRLHVSLTFGAAHALQALRALRRGDTGSVRRAWTRRRCYYSAEVCVLLCGLSLNTRLGPQYTTPRLLRRIIAANHPASSAVE